jgi:hypothetical protein
MPEVEAQPAPVVPVPVAPEGGITPDAVASTHQETLPDESIVANRMQGLYEQSGAIEQRREQEGQVAELQEELQFLRRLHGTRFDQKYDEVQDKVMSGDDNQSMIMKKVQQELVELKRGKEDLATRLENSKYEQEMAQAQRDVVSYVKANDEHFPLINELGEPELVFQKMVEHQQITGQAISEARATREVEQQLSLIVERLAPKLGYSKGEVRKTPSEESVSISSGMSTTQSVPDPKGMSDEDRLKFLVRKHTQQQG